MLFTQEQFQNQISIKEERDRLKEIEPFLTEEEKRRIDNRTSEIIGDRKECRFLGIKYLNPSVPRAKLAAYLELERGI